MENLVSIDYQLPTLTRIQTCAQTTSAETHPYHIKVPTRLEPRSTPTEYPLTSSTSPLGLVMAPAKSKRETILPQRAKYTLKLGDISHTRGDNYFFIVAEAVPDGGIKWNPGCPGDAKFNLSTVLGNENGSFAWGRSGFELSGKPESFELSEDPNTRAYKLTGELLDLTGLYKPASINLDTHLKVDDYVDEYTNEIYPRLTTKKKMRTTRTLVLCFDGTSNNFSTKNTNVVKLVELLKKDDPERQMVYYQTGIGTYMPPGFITSISLAGFIASTADEAVAWYLDQHVIDGYKYLMQTYRWGDRIALFGYSRGAFTARALAGMLHYVGLLSRHNLEHVQFAYKIYQNANLGTSKKDKGHGDGGLQPQEVDHERFKKTFCTPIVIDFVGVWDTVASVGTLYPKTLPFIDYNPSILTFRQALALDERRGHFTPSLWNHRHTSPAQSVREVWFKGEHSDVGGGSVEGDRSMLSNIPLRWMVRQLLKCQMGILLDTESVERYRECGVIERAPLVNGESPKYWRMRVNKSVELDKQDIIHPITESIGLHPLWNILEYFGFTSKQVRGEDFELEVSNLPNFKRPRSVHRLRVRKDTDARDTDSVYLHSSVAYYLDLLESKVKARDEAREAARQLQANDNTPPDGLLTKAFNSLKALIDKQPPEQNPIDDYAPRAKWYGYEGEDDWPWIEDRQMNINIRLPDNPDNIDAAANEEELQQEAELQQVGPPEGGLERVIKLSSEAQNRLRANMVRTLPDLDPPPERELENVNDVKLWPGSDPLPF